MSALASFASEKKNPAELEGRLACIVNGDGGRHIQRISSEIVSQPTRGRRRGFALEHISNTSEIFKRQVHGAEPFTEKVGVPLLESPATKESSRMQVLSFLFFLFFSQMTWHEKVLSGRVARIS